MLCAMRLQAQAAGSVLPVSELPEDPGMLVASLLGADGQSAQTAPAAAPAAQQGQSQQNQSEQNQAPNAKSQHDQAEEQLKQQEHQRILGVVPNFSTTDNQNALPLSAGQKFRLMFRGVTDPFEFVAAGADAGISQAEDDFPGYGQGAQGYGKRFGASYADTFDGALWGNAIFPALLHQDPRYFRKGTGSFTSRLLYAASTTVWTKNDNGKWGPNYSNVAGNIVAGGISNLYYPASDRGAGLTFERAMTVTAEGAIGSVAVEFWPDIARKIFHKKDAYAPPAPKH